MFDIIGHFRTEDCVLLVFFLVLLVISFGHFWKAVFLFCWPILARLGLHFYCFGPFLPF